MRFLILGGTSFVGRAIVEELLRRDHDVTLFGRGKTGPELFPGVERRVGDRATGDYASLAGGGWDAVVDVSGYVPRHVGQAMDAVGDGAGRYLFISTGAVYDYSRAPAGSLDEDCPRVEPRRDTEEFNGAAYGPLKVACEDDVLARFGDRATIVRPGIVAGVHDPSDRFTYWVRAAAGGGKVEIPGRLAQPVQVVDADDLAVLVVSLLEQDRSGTYNAVGRSMPFEELVRACTPLELELVEVSQGEAPMLVSDPGSDIMFTRSAARAHAAGMPQTPVAETAAKVRAWDIARGEPALKPW